MRIAVVADSHLAARAPECVSNWLAAELAVARLGADLTVHLGDISLDGVERPDELAYAAELGRSWPTPMRHVPGNHDMGDGSGEKPLDASRLAAYEARFGPGHWAVSAGRWELIGLNAQLFGTGSTAEAAQWQWLDAHVGGMRSQEHAVLFLHRPVIRPPDRLADRASGGPPPAWHAAHGPESMRRGRYVPVDAARRLMDGPLRSTLRAVVSGHTHQYLDRCVDGVRHLWLPSTAFVLPDEIQARVGEKLVGLGVLELGGAAVWFDLMCPDGMRRHDLSELGFYRSARSINEGQESGR